MQDFKVNSKRSSFFVKKFITALSLSFVLQGFFFNKECMKGGGESNRIVTKTNVQDFTTKISNMDIAGLIAEDDKGYTIFYALVNKDKYEKLKIFLDRCQQLDPDFKNQGFINMINKIYPSGYSTLGRLIKNGDKIKIYNLLMKRIGHRIDIEKLAIAFIAALAYKRTKIAKALLNNPNTDLTKKHPYSGDIWLHWAIRNGYKEIARDGINKVLKLNREAWDVLFQENKDRKPTTPYFLAKRKNMKCVVEKLADLSKENPEWRKTVEKDNDKYADEILDDAFCLLACSP